ncbi:MAG: glutamine synthetase [Firmicutes bacterium]|nr:glutamine synthetase [Bacillota bacterium]
MKYTAEEVIQYVKEEEIQFIRLAFCDVFGRQKNVAITATELERAFDFGIAFDASAIKGFGGEVKSDLFLHPDPSTLSSLPWRPESGRVVKMFCDVSYPDGTPFEANSRNILKKAVEEAAKKGISFMFGAEMEFYLFKTDENGNNSFEPCDHAGYMDVAPDDRGENVRREICMTLEHMGIQPESSHHEEGPGQNEIDFHYAEPLKAAEDALTFRSVVKTVAERNGLAADFMPRPLDDEAGSGMHINFSVKSEDGEDKLNYVIAGIIAKIKDMTVFLNSCKNSYDRLGGRKKAPAYISWSRENRSQLIRIPATPKGQERGELRSPDPIANPYIAFALIIYAGLYGIENKLELPPCADVNLYSASQAEVAKYDSLPISYTRAAAVANESGFIHRSLPESVISMYCNNRVLKY